MFTKILLNLFFIYVAHMLSNSCLLQMEQEMEKRMISVDSVRYIGQISLATLTSVGSFFERKFDGFMVCKLKRITCLAKKFRKGRKSAFIKKRSPKVYPGLLHVI